MSLLLILLDLYLQFLHKPDTYSTTPMAIEPLFHLRSNSMAQPFNILFSPDPTSCHYCPYTTIGVDINITGPPPTPKTYKPNNILNTIIFIVMNEVNLGVCTNPPSTPHLSSMVTSLVNYTKKTWSSSHSQSSPGHNLVPCNKHSSSPPTIHVRNPGKPHTPTINITDQMLTSCINAPPNHHAHLGSSLQLTSDGANLPRPLAEHSLETHTPHPHQVYIHSNSLDSAFQRRIACYYVMLLVHFNFIIQHLHLTFIHSSHWKILLWQIY